MFSPAAPNHFTLATGQAIQASGGASGVTINIGNNSGGNPQIQLNSLNATFYKTSVTQAGDNGSGSGFLLGNGTTCSLFTIDPGAKNTLNINSIISGSCDVQLGPLGGGGAQNTINLNSQNTYSGVTIFSQGVNGVVYLGTSNALPTTTDLMFAPINGNSYQQKLDLAGNNQTVASLSYWAAAATDSYGNGFSNQIQVVCGPNSAGTTSVATLTVSGAVSPSRPYGGIFGDGDGGLGGLLTLVKDGSNTLWLNNGANGYNGGTTVKNGLLLLSPSSASTTPLGNGDVTVSGGTLQGLATIPGNLNVIGSGTIHPGLANSLAVGEAPGYIYVSTNGTIGSGTTSQFDFGTSSSSKVLVTGVLTLPASGSATINLTDLGGLSGIVPLFTYGMLGNSFSTSQLSIGASPDGASAYAFRSTGSTAASGEIDLIAPSKLIWTGSAGSNVWNTNNVANFTALGVTTSFNSNLAAYGVKDHVTFDDTGSGGVVSIAGSGVVPQAVVFNNGAKSYDLTGGPITGSTSLVLTGSGQVTLDNSNSYSGGTFVNSGTLVVDSTSGIESGTNLSVGSMTSLFTHAPIVPDGIAGASVAAVPEPGTLALLAAGMAIVAFRVARRRK